jgi:hypothetical protein
MFQKVELKPRKLFRQYSSRGFSTDRSLQRQALLVAIVSANMHHRTVATKERQKTRKTYEDDGKQVVVFLMCMMILNCHTLMLKWPGCYVMEVHANIRLGRALLWYTFSEFGDADLPLDLFQRINEAYKEIGLQRIVRTLSKFLLFSLLGEKVLPSRRKLLREEAVLRFGDSGPERMAAPRVHDQSSSERKEFFASANTIL